jgi:4-carboxymuconolactone decarboxylase
LVAARYWSAQFEWVHHVPSARRAGISEEIITSISYAKIPKFSDPFMQAVFDYCAELHRDKEVTDKTYENAVAQLSATSVIDLTAICGYYTLISMTIKAFRVHETSDINLPELSLSPDEFFLVG